MVVPCTDTAASPESGATVSGLSDVPSTLLKLVARHHSMASQARTVMRMSNVAEVITEAVTFTAMARLAAKVHNTSPAENARTAPTRNRKGVWARQTDAQTKNRRLSPGSRASLSYSLGSGFCGGLLSAKCILGQGEMEGTDVTIRTHCTVVCPNPRR